MSKQKSVPRICLKRWFDVLLLVQSADPFEMKYSCSEEIIQKWFGDKAGELAEWFVKTDMRWGDQQDQAEFLAVKEWAQKSQDK